MRHAADGDDCAGRRAEIAAATLQRPPAAAAEAQQRHSHLASPHASLERRKTERKRYARCQACVNLTPRYTCCRHLSAPRDSDPPPPRSTHQGGKHPMKERKKESFLATGAAPIPCSTAGPAAARAPPAATAPAARRPAAAGARPAAPPRSRQAAGGEGAQLTCRAKPSEGCDSTGGPSLT
jgi:hypothetical protein